MKMKLVKNKKHLKQNFSRKVLLLQTTADFTSRVGKSYVPLTCKLPMVMYFAPILHKRCRSKTNFYVFSYDKTSLKFCASFRFFLTVFMEKLQQNMLSELCEKRNRMSDRPVGDLFCFSNTISMLAFVRYSIFCLRITLL